MNNTSLSKIMLIFATTSSSNDKKVYWNKWYKKNKSKFLKTINKHKKQRRKDFQKAIDEYKKDKECVVCGKIYDVVAMDLYHRDKNEKKFSISDAKNLIYSLSKLTEELNKCDVYCAACRRIIDTEELLKNKNTLPKKRKRDILKALVNKVKEQPCADCGEIYPSYVMELDHLQPEDKSGTISKMINKEDNIENIKNEINKTEVVCLICHRIRTKQRRGQIEEYEIKLELESEPKSKFGDEFKEITQTKSQ